MKIRSSGRFDELEGVLKRDHQRREARVDVQRAGYGRNVGLQRRNADHHRVGLVGAVVHGIETHLVGAYRPETGNHKAVAIDRTRTRNGLAGIGLILGTRIEVILVIGDRIAEISAPVDGRELHVREHSGRDGIPQTIALGLAAHKACGKQGRHDNYMIFGFHNNNFSISVLPIN